MKRTLIGLAVAAMLVCLPQLLRADDDKKTDVTDPAELFKKLDANHDGFLTADEIPADKKQLFERLLRTADKNKDGKLSEEEFVTALKTPASDKPASKTEPGEKPAAKTEPGEKPATTSTPAPGRGRPIDGATRDEIFKRLDKNGDGKLTLDEIPEGRRERFKAIFKQLGKKDTDSITKEEFESIQPGLGRPEGGRPEAGQRPDGRRAAAGLAIFKALDTNGDGELSSDEIAAASDVLKKLAKNSDGKLKLEDLVNKGSESRDSQPSSRPAGPPREPGMAAEALIKRFDKNGDGKLSKDEVPDWLKEGFDAIDTNKDGFLDESELKAAGRRLMERRAEGGPVGRRANPDKPNPEKSDPPKGDDKPKQ